MSVRTIRFRQPSLVKPWVRKTMAVWRALKDGGFLGKIMIYPAIGVDCLPLAAGARVLGVNWYDYKRADIMEHVDPILSRQLASRLKTMINYGELTYRSNLDTCNTQELKAVLRPFRSTSPKSLVLKHYFEYAFLKEWDMETERYYDVPWSDAMIKARRWTANMLKWLRPGDTVVAFDPVFYKILKEQAGDLKEVHTGFSRRENRTDVIYECGVPVISLPDYAWVFRRISS